MSGTFPGSLFENSGLFYEMCDFSVDAFWCKQINKNWWIQLCNSQIVLKNMLLIVYSCLFYIKMWVKASINYISDLHNIVWIRHCKCNCYWEGKDVAVKMWQDKPNTTKSKNWKCAELLDQCFWFDIIVCFYDVAIWFEERFGYRMIDNDMKLFLTKRSLLATYSQAVVCKIHV